MKYGFPEAGEGERGILLFHLGGRRHAVEVGAVHRISSREQEDWIRSSILGRPERPRRGLVTALDGEERALAVDEVLGVERVSAREISALPAIARDTIRTRGIAGLVTREEELLLLVDLPQLIRESEESTPDA